MTFHSIVKRWCEAYRFMRHSRDNKRFYLTDSTSGVVDMAKSISNSLTPCVVMESGVEGGGPIRRPVRNYPVYFFVRADRMADGDDAAVAKEEAWMHAQNFLAWLLERHNAELDKGRLDGDFARISLDDYIDIQTVGPLENGWFGVMIQFEREEPLNLCVNEDLYDAMPCDGCGCAEGEETDEGHGSEEE